MPIIKTPEGKWMQDTRDMIEKFEQLYPTPPVFPKDSLERFISGLFEAWGDEFWVPVAMHYRWNYNESVEFFKNEASTNLFPFFVPKFIKSMVADKVARGLISYLPSVGIRPTQYQMIELWAKDILQKLDNHFATHPFLLGNAPTIGDFGLSGPIIAHLTRDPYPKNNLSVHYPNVIAWADRMRSGEKSTISTNQTCSTSEIPDTLIPLLQAIFQEFLPMIKETMPHIQKLETNPKFMLKSKGGLGRSLPRALGDIKFPYNNQQFEFSKRALPFNVWKFQRGVLEEYNKDPQGIQKFLQEKNISNREILNQLAGPKLKRVALSVKFAE
jgi:glutathione S-transferase